MRYNPPTWPFFFALAIRMANMSAIILKIIGDNGSPCLIPLLV
jgi:hypothetical protein